jgi:hypothetical protein
VLYGVPAAGVPIAPPDGGTLVTLLDAGNYIIGLPEHVHTAAEWQAAWKP